MHRPILALSLLLFTFPLLIPQTAAASKIRMGGHITLGDDNTRITIAFSDQMRRAIHRWHYGDRRDHDDYRYRDHDRRDRYDRDDDDWDDDDHAYRRENRHLEHYYYTPAPPHLRHHIRRGHHLPKGLKRHNLPYDLEQRLPRLPRDYVRFRVGTHFVVYNTRTHLVVDLFRLDTYR